MSTKGMTVICAYCGREVAIYDAKEIFTGRRRHICIACDKQGAREADAHHAEWVATKQGKDILELARRNR